MANAIISSYLADKTVPVDKRRAAAEALNNGSIDEAGAMHGITAKYGNKYGSIPKAESAASQVGSFLGHAAGNALSAAPSIATNFLKGQAEVGRNMSPEFQASLATQNAASADKWNSDLSREQAAGKKAASVGQILPATIPKQGSTTGETLTPGTEDYIKAKEGIASSMQSASDAQNPVLSFATKTAGAMGNAISSAGQGLGDMATAGSDTVKMASGFGKVANAIPGVIGAPVSAGLSMTPQLVQDAANTLTQVPANLTALAAKSALDPANKQYVRNIPGVSEAVSAISSLRQIMGQNPNIDVNSDEYKQGVEEPLKNAVNFFMLRSGVKNPEAIGETASNIVGKAGEVTGKAADLTNKVIDNAKEAVIGKAPTPESVAGQIIQGKAKDIAAAKRVLNGVNESKYSDVSTTLRTRLKKLKADQETELGKSDITYKLKDFDKSVTSGDTTIQTNPVSDALNQLHELYTKTNSPADLARITDLYNKAQKHSLSLNDVNKIAMEYGTEFGKKAFSKSGEPLTSTNAVAYENTRTAIKQSVRDEMPADSTSASIDKQIHETISVKDKIDAMAEKVNQLTQKVQQRGLGEKIGRAIGTGVDFATGHALKGIVEKFLSRGTGLKTLNALDLEAMLSKNLTTLNKLNKLADENPDKFVKNIKLMDTANKSSKAK